MGSGDYNSGGFTQGGDGTVFGNPGSDPGSIQDYSNWDWKQIEAAINGMSAGVDNSANSSHAKSVSDPQSLQDAADIFYQVQQVLSGVAQALTDQAKALAGDNGPWKGNAADSFLTMMETFSKQVTATAAALSGGTSGLNSVPQQLANNAVNLVNAQNLISEIDTYYANEAVKSGVTPMSNGLIPISQRPQLVEWMNEDMRAVLKSLAGEYQVTIDSVRSPGPVTSPLGNNPPPTTSGGPNQPNFTDNLPSPVTPDLSSLRTAGTVQPLTPMSLDPSQLGTGNNLKSLDPNQLSRLSGSSGLGAGPGIGGLNPSAFDRALNPSAYSGGLGTGGTGGLGGALGPLGLGAASLLPRSGNLGTGGKGGLPAGESAFKSSAFPGAKGVGGAGSVGGVGGLGAARPGKLSTGDGVGGLGAGQRFPGSTSLESGLPGSGAAQPGVGAAGGLGEGMPYMPGMGGGAGQAAGHHGERSDASGLLDASGKPWAGATNVGGDIGHHLGTAAGGAGLSLPTEHAPATGTLPGEGAGSASGAPGGLGADGALGGGMPFMPGMGGGAAHASGNHGERSDASGLLAASAEPWAGAAALGGEVGSHLGAAAGGEGLGLPGERSPAEPLTASTGEAAAAASEQAAAEAAAGEGMPFLPGMGGAAGQAAGAREGERSEASGLLDPSADPWSGDPLEAEPESRPTAPGGEGLTLAAAAAAAAAVATATAVATAQGATRNGTAETAVAAATAGQPGATATPSSGQGAAQHGASAVAPGTTHVGGQFGATATGNPGQGTGAHGTSAPRAAEAAIAAPAAGQPGVTAAGGSGLGAAQQGASAVATGATHVSGQPGATATGNPGQGTAAHGTSAARAAEAAVAGPAAGQSGAPTTGTPGQATAQHGAGAVAGAPSGQAPVGTAAWGGTAAAGHAPGAQAGVPAAHGASAVGEAAATIAGAAAVAGPAPQQHAVARPGVNAATAAGAADWAGVDEEGDFAEVELAAPATASGAGSAVLGGEAVAGWDGAGVAFVPLLRSLPVEEEGDVRAPGYATTEREAWGEVPAAPPASGRADEEEPRFATWRPNRSIVTTSSEGGGGSPVVYRSGATEGFEEELAPEPEPEEPAEEKPGRGAADLLVQESDTWGVAADDDFDAII